MKIASAVIVMLLALAGCQEQKPDVLPPYCWNCAQPAPARQQPPRQEQGGTVHPGEHCDPAVDFRKDGLTCYGGLTAPPGQADTWQPS